MKHTALWYFLFTPICLVGSFAANAQVIIPDQSNLTIQGAIEEPVIQLQAPAPSNDGGSTPSIGNQTLSPAVQGQSIVKEPLLKKPDQTLQIVKPIAKEPAPNTLKPTGEIAGADKGGLQNEPGLKDIESLSAVAKLKLASRSNSLLGNGDAGKLGSFGSLPGLPGGETNASGFGKSAMPGTKSGGLPGLSGMPSLSGAAGNAGGAGGAPKLPGLGGLGTKTGSSLLAGSGLLPKGSALPGKPGPATLPGAAGGGFGGKTPGMKLPGNMSPGAPSDVFGAKSRTITSAPGMEQGIQSSSISGLAGGSSAIMAGGKTEKPKNTNNTKPKNKTDNNPPIIKSKDNNKPPLPGDAKSKTKTKQKEKKRTKFSKEELPMAKSLMVRLEKKMAKNKASEKEVKLYHKLDRLVKASEKKKKPGKGVWESGKCNPNDPNCDMTTEEEKIVMVKEAVRKAAGRGEGQGDDMKPVGEDDGNDGSHSITLGSSVISRPASSSQSANSGGGRLVTDLEKTGNPGAETE
ncbi:MAG: hypothetical protein ACI8P9_004877 [Parasphingorhabdus sp.]|jgi:hypothetical protein